MKGRVVQGYRVPWIYKMSKQQGRACGNHGGAPLDLVKRKLVARN